MISEFKSTHISLYVGRYVLTCWLDCLYETKRRKQQTSSYVVMPTTLVRFWGLLWGNMSLEEEMTMSSEAPDFQKTPEDFENEGQMIENNEAQILKVGCYQSKHNWEWYRFRIPRYNNAVFYVWFQNIMEYNATNIEMNNTKDDQVSSFT